MSEVRLIRIKEEILSENRALADELRSDLAGRGVLLVNLMSSPGAGKTSLILRSIEHLRGAHGLAVIEGDVDSAVDAERVAREGVPAVQIQTGGACHLTAAMVEKGLGSLHLDGLDFLFLENIGNLICPAGSDTGAHLNVVLLSVPEGDDKPLKYPRIFQTADVVLVNKTDVLEYFDFDVGEFERRVRRLNPRAPVIPLSCKTGEGIEGWCGWLREKGGA
jgi:hydrogenase nickel incorporation protein HypB